MTPERLTATGTSEERELLQSALQDRAVPGGKEQLLAVLVGTATLAATAAAEGASLVGGAGVSGTGAGGVATTGAVTTGPVGTSVAATGVVGTSVTATGVAGGGSVGTATGAVGGAASIGLFGVAKWVGIGLLAGTTTTAVVATTAAPPAVQVEEPVSISASMPEPPALRPQPEEPTTVVTPVVPAAEELEAAPSARPRVGEEIEVLDRARTALQRGDTAGARQALGEYRRTFPQGVMGPEAAVLDVRAALAGGDRERAASLARSFLVRHGNSPHAPRMRALLASATAPGAEAGAVEKPVKTRVASPRPAAAVLETEEIPTATPSRTPSVARFAD